MPEKPECYGTMFPDLSRLEYNRTCKGKVFTAMTTEFGWIVPRAAVTRALSVAWRLSSALGAAATVARAT